MAIPTFPRDKASDEAPGFFRDRIRYRLIREALGPSIRAMASRRARLRLDASAIFLLREKNGIASGNLREPDDERLTSPPQCQHLWRTAPV